MKTEIRFLLALALMMGVLFGTNLLFPPVVPEGDLLTDSTGVGVDSTPAVGAEEEEGGVRLPAAGDPGLPEGLGQTESATAPMADRRVDVSGPLYRFQFSTQGARLVEAEMSRFPALNREGLVDLVPEGANGFLDMALVVGRDTVDLSRAPFTVEPEQGLTLSEGSGPATLRFAYAHPSGGLRVELEYQFEPDRYMMNVRGRVVGLDRPLVLTHLGPGLAFTEADSANEARTMAFVYNHLANGIESTASSRGEPEVVEGPLLWAATRSKFFVMAMLAEEGDGGDPADAPHLGGLLVRPTALTDRVDLAVAQPAETDGTFGYRLYMGPQDYGRLSSLGQEMEQVNPYGWKFFRPIIRPFVSIIMAILVFLHTNLGIGYGWVLVIFGVIMRVVLFPLNHKAMKAQLRNMAVQPLVQEIQTRYKDNPEKLQKEMMKLYKDHGFNPFAGCVPMLLPWPVLIALFFVFQNTIELRGVSFLWLPDLSAKDPLYILPLMLAASMFLMQWVSMRALDQPNPQMKMMMWMMPGMMLMIFLNLASGLNLYYATTNLATIPQQVWINNERKKMKGRPPPKLRAD